MVRITTMNPMLKKQLLPLMPFYLLFIAGIVDVIGFLHLKNGLFVSFMSGNTTHVGILLNEPSNPLIWHYVGVIGLFVFGAMIGEMLALSAFRYYRCIIMAIVALLLSITALITNHTAPIVTNFVLSFAMGIQNTALRATIDKATALTYVTGFLVNTGRSLALLLMGHREQSAFLRHLLLWLSNYLGAITGAKVMTGSLTTALITPIVLSLIATVILYWTHELADA